MKDYDQFNELLISGSAFFLLVEDENDPNI